MLNTLSFLSAIEAFSRFQSSGTFLLYLQEHLSNKLLCHNHVVYGLLAPHFFKILFPDQDDHYRHIFTCFWSRYSASSFSSVTALLGSAVGRMARAGGLPIAGLWEDLLSGPWSCCPTARPDVQASIAGPPEILYIGKLLVIKSQLHDVAYNRMSNYKSK